MNLNPRDGVPPPYRGEPPIEPFFVIVTEPGYPPTQQVISDVWNLGYEDGIFVAMMKDGRMVCFECPPRGSVTSSNTRPTEKGAA